MTFKPRQHRDHLYFVTATVLGWKPLFTRPDYASIILNSLEWHRQQERWLLFAYVLMPNHLHALLKPCASYTISQVVQSFGSFTAHALLDQLRENQRTALLRFFTQRPDRDESKRHQIWRPIQAKNVYSERFLRQKFAYLHNNPVAKGWDLAEDREDYPYSSACFYDRGDKPSVPVTNLWAWWYGDDEEFAEAAPGYGGLEHL
jgi:REP element-mobilizing transposase RayT